MFKNFLMKKMLQVKLKDVPKDQREMIMTILEKNPDLFTKIGKEIETKVKAGRSQQAASIEVMKTHQKELRDLLR